MSDPAIPTHLEAEIAEYERYGDDFGLDRRNRLLGDLIVARAIPAKFEAEVNAAVADGWLSSSGDVLRYEDDAV